MRWHILASCRWVHASQNEKSKEIGNCCEIWWEWRGALWISNKIRRTKVDTIPRESGQSTSTRNPVMDYDISTKGDPTHHGRPTVRRGHRLLKDTAVKAAASIEPFPSRNPTCANSKLMMASKHNEGKDSEQTANAPPLCARSPPTKAMTRLNMMNGEQDILRPPKQAICGTLWYQSVRRNECESTQQRGQDAPFCITREELLVFTPRKMRARRKLVGCVRR
jgi:hypothetical protein